MSKEDMVKAFCQYWGVGEQDVRAIGNKFDATLQELMQAIEAGVSDTEKSALQDKLADLAQEFSQAYNMLYMTAASYGVVKQANKESAKNERPRAKIIA